MRRERLAAELPECRGSRWPLGTLAERCPCSLGVACLHLEAVLRRNPQQGAPMVLSETTRWMRKNPDEPELLCVRGKALCAT